MRRIRDDVRWGIGWGLEIAAVLSAIAVVGIIVRALVVGGVRGVPLILSFTLALYLFAAIVSGTVVGLLRPLARHWIGSALIGFLAALPVCVGTYAALVGLSQVSTPILILSAVTALLLGGGLGIWVWFDTS